MKRSPIDLSAIDEDLRSLETVLRIAIEAGFKDILAESSEELWRWLSEFGRLLAIVAEPAEKEAIASRYAHALALLELIETAAPLPHGHSL
jgi:hypothetical protein